MLRVITVVTKWMERFAWTIWIESVPVTGTPSCAMATNILANLNFSGSQNDWGWNFIGLWLNKRNVVCLTCTQADHSHLFPGSAALVSRFFFIKIASCVCLNSWERNVRMIRVNQIVRNKNAQDEPKIWWVRWNVRGIFTTWFRLFDRENEKLANDDCW